MELLTKYINESGLKKTAIATKLGITYVGLHYKLSGRNKFTLQEAFKLQEILNIPDKDWKLIFKEVE